MWRVKVSWRQQQTWGHWTLSFSIVCTGQQGATQLTTNKAHAISRRIRHFITMINIPHFASVNNLFLILMWLEGEFERFEVNFTTRAAINISKFIHTFHCCYIGVGGEQIIMKRGKFWSSLPVIREWTINGRFISAVRVPHAISMLFGGRRQRRNEWIFIKITAAHLWANFVRRHDTRPTRFHFIIVIIPSTSLCA